MDNIGTENKLTKEDPNYRKQESLKSNIFNFDETHTCKKEKYTTGKPKVHEDKVFEVFEKKTIENKRNELCSHFHLGDNVEFSDIYKNLGEYNKKEIYKIDNPNEEKKNDQH